MDIATLIGVLLCLVLMIFGIVFDASVGVNFGALVNFVDIPSVLITIGGSMMCVFASHSIEEFVSGLTAYSKIIQNPTNDVGAAIQQIVQLSNTARKEGLLALENWMKKIGVSLNITELGAKPEMIEGMADATFILKGGYKVLDRQEIVQILKESL